MSPLEYPPRLALTPINGPVNAEVRLPGSKSITNRALPLAAMADGTSVLRGALHSEDTHYMIDALRNLGVTITEDPQDRTTLIVQGRSGQFAAPTSLPDASLQTPVQSPQDWGLGGRSLPVQGGGRSPRLFIGNSGTTVRFLTAAACLIPEGTDVVLDGVARMRERPIRDLLGALIALGAQVESVDGHGCPPVRIHGGGLEGGRCSLRGDVSSQFLTALLQVAPYARQDVEITIVGDLISKPYVDITQSVMRAFGADFENDGYKTLRVKAGQRYKAADYEIEADASNASYFMAAAAVTGGKVRLANLGTSSIQGDVRFADVLERMGCTVTRGDSLTIQGPTQLRGIDVDMQSIPDTAQTLAVVAAFADGPSHIIGLGSLRVKETDRIAAVTTELTKMGVRVEEGRESWTIHPLSPLAAPPLLGAGGRPTPPLLGAGGIPLPPNPGGKKEIARLATSEVVINTYQDHRMAMSFAVAGLRLPGIVIDDPGCVAKTFPDFWQRWKEAFGSA